MGNLQVATGSLDIKLSLFEYGLFCLGFFFSNGIRIGFGLPCDSLTVVDTGFFWNAAAAVFLKN